MKFFIFRFLGNGDGDLKKAHMLVEHYLKLNPDVSISSFQIFYSINRIHYFRKIFNSVCFEDKSLGMLLFYLPKHIRSF
jgi:hypothetical protein